MEDSRSVRAARRLYALAVRTLPVHFRASFGEDLLLDFTEIARRARASRGGLLALAAASARGLMDVVYCAWRERRRAGESQDPAQALWRERRGRRVQPMEALMHWWSELQVAARTLARRPGFTVAAVLTLGLGIGANVAIFAVVDAILIRPLPYPESERIVVITHHAPGLNLPTLENSEGTLKLYRESARSFSAIARVDGNMRNLTGGDRPARVRGAEVSPEMFDVMRTEPVLGRRFVDGDSKIGAPPTVAILTHKGWQTHFAGARDVIGRTVRLDGATVEIVGVMPPRFQYPHPETEVLLARGVDPNGAFGAFGLAGIARLAPGVTAEAAQRELAALQPRFAEMDEDLNATFLKKAGWSVTVTPMRDDEVADVRTTLWIVFGTVGLVLLIACANVANLFLVRAEGRQREIAVRAAMGASRTRLAWLFLSESTLLGLAGGIVGTTIASLGIRALVNAGSVDLPRLHEITIDARTLVFATLISLLAGLTFGLLPLPRFLRTTSGALREARGETGSRERHRMRKTLIAAQVALALVLLVGSGLMLRSFQRLRAVDPGIRTENVLTIGISRADGGSTRGAGGTSLEAARFYHAILEKVAVLPGVQAVGATNSLPIQPDGLNGGSFDVEDVPGVPGEIPPVAMWSAISHGYLETAGIPLRQGRTVERRDDETVSNAAWINEAFLKALFPGKNPIGKRIRIDQTTWLEVVGVVGDVRTFGLDQPVKPMIYLPLGTPSGGVSISFMHLMLRTPLATEAVLPAVRKLIADADNNVPLTTARTMDEILRASIADTTFTMTVLGIAAIVALLLGAIGLYGVITYVVTQRTREIGVRIALGAAPQTVLLMVVRQGLTVVVAGLIVGAAAALALTRLMQGLLFEVSTRDPVTFIGVGLVLLVVSAIAAWLPARRASALSPMEALRTE